MDVDVELDEMSEDKKGGATEKGGSDKKKRRKSKKTGMDTKLLEEQEKEKDQKYKVRDREIKARLEDKEEEDDDKEQRDGLLGDPALDNEIQNLLKSDTNPFNDNISLITDDALQQLKQKLDTEVFVTNQLTILFTAFDQYHFSCDQVKMLIESFPYYEMKNQAVTRGFPTLVDKQNFKSLLFSQVFSDLERRVIIEKLEHTGTTQ